MTSYIVALDREIVPGGLFRSKLGEIDLVLWRGASGKVHVWEDRCPHRSVQLSAGRNMGDYLEGAYHGWRFGEDGSVLNIPAENGQARPDISARMFSSCLSNGFIWASEAAVQPDEDFRGTPTRPLHFARPESRVRPLLDSSVTRVTPWGISSCMVYALTDEQDQLHSDLCQLRRKLENVA